MLMENLRNLVNRNLLVVFATAILFPVVASGNDIPLAIQKAELANNQSLPYKPSKQTYLPAGSFFSAELITEIQLPVDKTDTKLPVMLKITSPVNLPNDGTTTVLDGCFVIAEGYGDKTAERAALRLSKLSCMDKNGKTRIDQSIQGFVIDPLDGFIGLRGKMIKSKTTGNTLDVEPKREATVTVSQGISLAEKD